jgi:hypothetical protein
MVFFKLLQGFDQLRGIEFHVLGLLARS